MYCYVLLKAVKRYEQYKNYRRTGDAQILLLHCYQYHEDSLQSLPMQNNQIYMCMIREYYHHTAMDREMNVDLVLNNLAIDRAQK